MLGVTGGHMGSSSDGAAAAAAAAAAEAHESGGGGSGGSSEVGASSSIPGGTMEESERSGGGGGGGGGGGNRWPRQETLALLKIRSEMDGTFRDSSLKGPLWDEVSRKMAELGFQRSSKKCKEKFENVYKYHKRTKDGRSSKSDGKTYRFFDQLEALENTTTSTPNPPPPPPPFTTAAAAPPPPPRPQLPLMLTNSAPTPPPLHTTVSSTTPNPVTTIFPNINTSGQPPLQHHQPQPNIIPSFQHLPRQHVSSARVQLSGSTSSSSSTSSDEDIQRRRGRKRKWKDFFERLMKDVINKQEDLHNKFLDTLEKRERDRTAREEAWRMQEITRLNREHELLVHERSVAAAKDAAVISFLQKVTEQHNLQIPIGNMNIVSAPPQVVPVQPQPPPENIPQPPPPQPKPVAAAVTTQTKIMDIVKVADNGGDHSTSSAAAASSSRWPKAEVEALIKLRTNLDIKYQENGPKGPLWEEISSAMAKIGYNRSSKRCKEKWENINKYFKKVKESNKKRPEDSKTCPYFHQLDAIYRERGSKNDVVSFPGYNNAENNIPMLPIMARPEQQWPLPDEQQQQRQHDSATAVANQYQDNESEDNGHGDGEDDGDDDDEEDEAQCYEIVTNKQPSSVTNAAE